jgi:uncharacterized repeat protein (TIGR03803 family)
LRHLGRWLLCRFEREFAPTNKSENEMSGSRMRAVAILTLCAALSPFAAHARKLTTLYTFSAGAGGFEPDGTLIYDHETLLGTTEYGGGTGCSNHHGCGTIFAIDSRTGAETILHDFDEAPNAEYPAGGLTPEGGNLFGTSIDGGAANLGTVFSFNRATGAETILYSFKGGTDGELPVAGLAYHDGMLFGTTTNSGSSGFGTVFAVDVSTGVETLLYAFKGRHDGNNPLAGVIYQSGELYGTTQLGGKDGCNGFTCGVVFKVDVKTGVETVLHAFKGGRDGSGPFAPLIYQGGMLYGTTAGGGGACTGGCGTVFQLNPATGAETVLYRFKDGQDGSAPLTPLLFQGDNLYGTTGFGGGTGCGGPGCGTVFVVDATTGAEKVLYRFTGQTDGNLPGGLVLHNHFLYGTAHWTLFKLKL